MIRRESCGILANSLNKIKSIHISWLGAAFNGLGCFGEKSERK